ncbi:MAG: endonuclease/exonuclease/phosphatase family protein [Devosia sp.]
MQITIATFNMENLFTRTAAMSGEPDNAKQQAIDDEKTGNTIVRKDVYSDEDKAALLEIAERYGMLKLNPPREALLFLQKVRGRLFATKKVGQKEHVPYVAADGRSDWVGWFELRRSDVSWAATLNTGRVIDAHKPDILLLVEVENRPTFKRFNEQVLKAEFGWSYPYFMVIDGNDDRGIDVGIASRFPIETIRSHVTDGQESGGRPTFSRDCPEYDLVLPGGKRIVVLPNHFKSQRNSSKKDREEANALRLKQATRANKIAMAAKKRSDLVLVAGDLNDVPDSAPLQPIFKGFSDVMDHADYPKDRPGTYGTGLKSGKFDYLLMSPALRKKLKTTGIERRGSYHPNIWTAFPEVTGPKNEASDHQMVWAKFDL